MKIPKSDKSLRFGVICKECQQKGRLAMFTLNSDLLLLNKICSSGEHRIKAQDKCAILNEQTSTQGKNSDEIKSKDNSINLGLCDHSYECSANANACKSVIDHGNVNISNSSTAFGSNNCNNTNLNN